MSDGATPKKRDQGTDRIAIVGRLRLAGERLLAPARREVTVALRQEADYGRGFLWVPVSMAVGAALWFCAPYAVALWPILLLTAASGVGALVWADRPGPRLALVVVFAGLLGCVAAAFETWRHGTILLDGEVTTRIVGTVVDRDIDARGHRRYTILVEQTREPTIHRPPQKVRVLARGGHESIAIGDRISGLARLQPPSGPALPGTFDFAFNAYFQGIGAFGFFYGAPQRFQSTEVVAHRGFAMAARLRLERLRESIADRIRTVLPGEAGAFAAALTVADRRMMSAETVEALRASGLAHVLAISGLHMALVAGTVFFAMRIGFGLFPVMAQSFPVKKWAAATALLVATAYLLLSGASVSTQRAWIMLAIVLTAVMIDRPALTLRNVALAAICIILLTPSAVLGPGFQMSFAATAALIAVYSWWRDRDNPPGHSGNSSVRWVRTILAFVIGLAVTALVAGLATAPFATYHFHRIASMGLIANVAAMPIVTFVVMPFGLIALLLMPFGLDDWPYQVMGVGLDAVLSVARAVEGLGGMVVTGRVPDVVFLKLVAGLLLLVLLRSRLRWFGVPVIAVALLYPSFGSEPTGSELLISEDGRLVSLVHAKALATNRARPPGFVMDQWQRALRRPVHIGPGRLEEDGWNFDGKDIENRAIFLCRKGALCLSRTASGRAVAVLEDLSLLGPACDRADIVVTNRHITLDACRSGALLVTGRMLRQIGSVELIAPSLDGHPRAVAAIEAGSRAWTIHRAYDWRSRTFRIARPDWADQ